MSLSWRKQRATLALAKAKHAKEILRYNYKEKFWIFVEKKEKYRFLAEAQWELERLY